MGGITQQDFLRQNMPAQPQQPAVSPEVGMNMPANRNNLSQEQMNYINGLPPNEQEAAIQALTQDYEGKRGTLGDEMANAQQAMGAAAPEGRQAGGVYTAANPLEHLASGLRKREGRDNYDTALSASKELNDQYGNGVRTRMEGGLKAAKDREYQRTMAMQLGR